MDGQMQFFEEENDSLESESDLEIISSDLSNKAVVTATDWTIETLINQIDKKNIILNPKFQRRDAWTIKRKSEFIESLFLGLPVPQIVLASHKEKKGKYIVIDGKQRLLSIRQFASNQTDPTFSKLKLSGLSVKDYLNGKGLEDLSNKTEFLDDVNSFENETLRTVVIKHWPNESFLYRVFLRLNTNSVGLSPQELRQALHPGEFIDFVDDYSQTSTALKDILKLKRPDFRMRDIEILIRYFAFKYFITEYRGSMKEFLDLVCARLNNAWDNLSQTIQDDAEKFEEAHLLATEVFEKPYRKWLGYGYESKFNRAILDIIIYYFSKPELATKISTSKLEVQQAFQNLCINDQKFLASVERTTKSIDATQYRFSAWADALTRVLGEKINAPILQKL